MGLFGSKQAVATQESEQGWQNFPRVIATLIEEYAVEPPPLCIQTIESKQIADWTYRPKLATRDGKLAVFMVSPALSVRQSILCIDLGSSKTVWESTQVPIQGFVEFVESETGDFIAANGDVALQLARDTGKTLRRIVVPHIKHLFATMNGFPWITTTDKHLQPLFHNTPKSAIDSRRHVAELMPEALGFDHVGIGRDACFLGGDTTLLFLKHNLPEEIEIRTFLVADRCIATTKDFRCLHILSLDYETESTREFAGQQKFDFANAGFSLEYAKFFTQDVRRAGLQAWLITAVPRFEDSMWLRLDTRTGHIVSERVPRVKPVHKFQFGDRVCAMRWDELLVFEHERETLKRKVCAQYVQTFPNVVLFFDPTAQRWCFVM